ncbi:MAG: enoyl-CoA hydratase/isomerase family protein [Propionibacteriaceae bacterium]|jgi:enoyl-CoA hydratase/carnithine racemase|nr:enoyl-CoA hydratase/isomerase family protein [Propionibacteriaceae bacterium]
MEWPQYETLIVGAEPDSRVTVVTLNRPAVLNAANPQMHNELIDVFRLIGQDSATGAVVLRGAGERAFCAGSDVKVTRGLTGQAARDYIALDMAAKNAVSGSRKPVIAALHGYVLGGGLELALACDLRIAAIGTVFALPEVALGTLPGAGGLQRLPELVGLGLAKEWALTGRRWDADEAARAGLVNRVVPGDQLSDQAQSLAATIASHNPLAVELIKAGLNADRPSVDLVGQTLAFHQLASAACHDQDFQAKAGAVGRGSGQS